MKKRLLSAVLALGMLFSCAAGLPQETFDLGSGITASAETDGNYTYTVQSDGTAKLTKYNGNETAVKIPSTVGGKTVTVLGKMMFAGLKANRTITSITIPNTVKTIDQSAFYWCQALTSLTIPDGVTTISDYAFKECTALTSISIPKSVTSLPGNAFDLCPALKTITVDSANTVFSSADGALYNKAKTSIVCIPSAKTSINIPGTVKSIPSFTGGMNTTSITLNEGTTTLEKWAFINCKEISSITIPSSVTTINTQAVGYYHATGSNTDPETKKTGFVIYGYAGSKAETYAKANGFTFQSIGTATSCTHSYGSPVWSWSGYSSATATFTCTKCSEKTTVKATITSSVTKQATCAATGTKTYTANATVGGSSYKTTKTETIAKTAHKYDSGKITKAATCAATGVKTYTCTVCKTTKTDTIAKSTTHTWSSYTITKKATCKDTGVKTYTCGVCKTATKTETIPVTTTHTWGAWTTTKPATDKTTGTKQRKCTVCGKIETATIPVTTHTHSYTSKVIPPTCTEQGYTEYTCSSCGDVYRNNFTSKTAHKYDSGKITKAATCAATGIKTYTCTVCKATKTETIAKSTTHTWDSGKITKAATCTATGVKTYTCTVCKATKTETVAKAAHKYDSGKITKAATCAATGVKTYTCTVCKATKTETVAKTAHKYDSGKITKAATCAATGVKTYTCTVCKATKTETVAKLTTHTWSSYTITKKATCKDTGVKTYTCGVCKTATKTETIPVITTHTWGAWTTTKPATATTAGTKQRKCTVCGKIETATIPVTTHTHSYTSKVIPPTCASQGYTEHTCSSCGYSYKDKYTAKKDLRAFGPNRYETATDIADHIPIDANGEKKFEKVIVASGTSFADALSASYLAKDGKTPILLVANAQPRIEELVFYISENAVKGAQIFIVGGYAAVPKTVGDQLENKGFKIKRFDGANRYETNIKVLEYAGVEKGSEILVASGLDYADALSASAVGKPIFLVAGKTLLKQQEDYLETLKGNKITATMIGGTGAVSSEISNQIMNYVGKSGRGKDKDSRIGGNNRYETSKMVADEYFPSAPTIALAYGLNYPDGLCGGPLAMAYKCPLLLTSNNNVNMSYAKAYAKAKGITSAIIFGGKTLISETAVDTILGR